MSAEKSAEYDLVGNLMAFDEGELDEQATITLFQYLVDTRMAWKLEGRYGRMAIALIDKGVVKRPDAIAQ